MLPPFVTISCSGPSVMSHSFIADTSVVPSTVWPRKFPGFPSHPAVIFDITAVGAAALPSPCQPAHRNAVTASPDIVNGDNVSNLQIRHEPVSKRFVPGAVRRLRTARAARCSETGADLSRSDALSDALS
jgi:hypothetical protein